MHTNKLYKSTHKSKISNKLICYYERFYVNMYDIYSTCVINTGVILNLLCYFGWG